MFNLQQIIDILMEILNTMMEKISLCRSWQEKNQFTQKRKKFIKKYVIVSLIIMVAGAWKKAKKQNQKNIVKKRKNRNRRKS